jgi:hypothetical protein
MSQSLTAEEMDIILGNVAAAINKLQNNVQQGFIDSSVRISVLETILTHPELKDMRLKLTTNGLEQSDLIAVAENYVIPEYQRQYEEAQAKLKAAQEAQESLIVTPNGEPASSGPRLVSVDGRPVSMRQKK